MKLFTKLAQANVDHYNNHTTRHTVITAVYGAVALVAVGAMSKKLGESCDPSK
jgi:hypothetical protein